MQKVKQKKKVTGTEGFFRAIQQDIVAIRKDMAAGFRAVHENMATKQDIRDIHKGMTDIREDVKQITDNMVSKADLAHIIRDELDKSPYAKEKEVEDLRHRVLRLEEKLGMKADRRAS
jgi:hypothetical protein